MSKNFKTLEVGKKYLTRGGKLVVIVSFSKNFMYPFIGDNGGSYGEGGSFYIGSEPDKDDLVTLVGEEPPELVTPSMEIAVKGDVVNSPSHYAFFPDTEVIDIIRAALTPEEFRGYCLGNKLKYHLRAGKKGDAKEDLGKAGKYEDFYKESV